MKSISSSDIVCATASYHGRTIATFTSTGFNSMSEVLSAVRNSVGSIVGLIDYSLLNHSKGWRQCRSMFIAPPAPGIQLTLF